MTSSDNTIYEVQVWASLTYPGVSGMFVNPISPYQRLFEVAEGCFVYIRDEHAELAPIGNADCFRTMKYLDFQNVFAYCLYRK